MICSSHLTTRISAQTPEGKALGRWVNNQRSAKTKGTLKPEREEKLLSTGMRWSIISTSSWQDMMNELLLYIEEKVRVQSFSSRGNVDVARCSLIGRFTNGVCL
jgi:hypothetical protein